EADDVLRAFRAGRPLDAGVNVFRVLAEDDHVDLLRLADGRRDAGEVAHGTHARVEVEDLPQRDVEGADAAADRRGQWSLDRDAVLLERLQRFVREVRAVVRVGLVAGEDLVPGDLALPAIDLRDRAIDDVRRGAPDVGSGAVAFDERDDRIVGNDDAAVLESDARAGGWFGEGLAHGGAKCRRKQ